MGGEYYMDEGALVERMVEVYGELPKELIVKILYVLVFINFPFWLMDTLLICFHIFLKWKGITTFEFFKSFRSRKAGPAKAADDDGGGGKGVIELKKGWGKPKLGKNKTAASSSKYQVVPSDCSKIEAETKN